MHYQREYTSLEGTGTSIRMLIDSADDYNPGTQLPQNSPGFRFCVTIISGGIEANIGLVMRFRASFRPILSEFSSVQLPQNATSDSPPCICITLNSDRRSSCEVTGRNELLRLICTDDEDVDVATLLFTEAWFARANRRRRNDASSSSTETICCWMLFDCCNCNCLW